MIRKMTENILKQRALFRKALREKANPERALNEKAYLKSPYKFFGVSVPIAEKIARDFKRAHMDASSKFVIALAKRLWDSEYHDEKRLGLRILQHYPGYLGLATMPMLGDMLKQATGWDFVDNISIHLVGTILEKDKRAFTYLKKWGRSGNFWIRRASLISQVLLFRKGIGDKRLFFRLAEDMISEKEFFIRKAIGWALREMSKTDPDSVFDFLMKIKDRASSLTLREGSKRLPEKMKEKILSK